MALCISQNGVQGAILLERQILKTEVVMVTKKGRETVVKFWHGGHEYTLAVNHDSKPDKILLVPSGTLLEVKYWDSRRALYPVHYVVANPYHGRLPLEQVEQIAKNIGAAIATIATSS